MVELIAGLILSALTAAVFIYSMPRHGKTAWFVGSEWEGYAVVLMVSGFGLFVLLGIGHLLS